MPDLAPERRGGAPPLSREPRNPWIWVGVGTGVAVLTAIIVAAAVLSSGEPDTIVRGVHVEGF
jgi:hypothetical protein